MKLNLGCGHDVKDGYVNVDFRKTHSSVIQHDLSIFPWMFEDSSADEILMLDFLEHFPWSQTQSILLECYRILNDEGTVVIQVPDAGHLSIALTMVGDYLCNRCGGNMHNSISYHTEACGTCGQSADWIAEEAMRRLYGGQDYTGNFHQTTFTKRSLELKAKKAGLSLVGFEEEEHQYINWNFKARFKKGDLW